MRLVGMAICALMLVSGVSSAAVATFEGVSLLGTTSGDPSFDAELAPLGVVSSSSASAEPRTGVYNVASWGYPLPPGWNGVQSFVLTGGTWTVNFNSQVNGFSFDWWDNNITTMTASIYNSSNVLLATITPMGIAYGNINFSGYGNISRLVIQDLGIDYPQYGGGDGVVLDNFQSTFAAIPPPPSVPEPSTFAMLGTALTGFAVYLRRRR
jgi:hypothetical protein